MRKGFALAEAMAMIIVAGMCMVPILGTLNSGVSRSKAVELRAAMQNAAESKMNEITDKCNYIGATPVNQTSSIDYPNATDTLFHFNVSVEVNEPVNLVEYDLPATGLAGSQDQDIKEVSVVVKLQETDPSIEPVCLFTLLARPKAYGDLIYACVPSQKNIYVINPRTYSTIDTYSTATGSHIPLHLAVHPNGDWLAIKCQNTVPLVSNILLMDLRRGSTTRGKYNVICATTTACGSDLADTDGNNNTRFDRGIEFRPDGKYLYFTSEIPSQISVIKTPVGFPPALDTLSASWTTPAVGAGTEWPASVNFGDADASDMTLGQDGYLYTCAYGTQAYHKRLNLYTHASTDFIPPYANNTTQLLNQRSITTTWGGNEIWGLYDGYYLGGSLSHAPTSVWDGTIQTGSDMTSANQSNDLLVSRNNSYVYGVSSKSGNAKHLFAWNRKGASTIWNPSTSPNMAVDTSNSRTCVSLKHSPYGKEFLVDTGDNYVLFVDHKNFVTNSGTIFNEWIPSPAANPSDVAARIAEYAWIACSNNTLQALDIYGGGTGGKIDEFKKITLSETPSHVSLSAGGDQALVGLDSANIPKIADCFDLTTANAGITFTNPNHTIKTAVLLDKSLMVALERSSCTHENHIYPDDDSNIGNSHNGFFVYQADATGTVAPDPKVGYDCQGNQGWLIRDIVAMHRRNGAYALFNNDSTNDAILVWVEKTTLPGFSGTAGTDEYKIMYKWQKSQDGFPEGRPSKMALSPDDSLLALFDTSAHPSDSLSQSLRIYDLQSQHLPIQPGLVMNRYTDIFDLSTAPASVTVDLKNEMTRFNDHTPSQKTNILNFDEGYRGGAAGGAYATRFFGTLYKPSGLTGFGSWFEDQGRHYVNGTVYNGAGGWTAGSAGGYSSFSCSPPDSTQFQIDMENDGVVWGTVCNYTTGAVSDPSGNDGTAYPTRLLNGGPAWLAFKARTFRAFRFRPELLREIVFTAAAPIWNTMTLFSKPAAADTDTLMAFHRDTSRSVLFLLDNKAGVGNKKLYGLGLNGETNWSSKTLPDADPYVDMNVSPDGRRLILVASGPAKVQIFDISYAIPFAAPNLSGMTPTGIDLPASPISLAVRPFNQMSGAPDTYAQVGTMTYNLSGTAVAAVASGGIYLVGGSDNESSVSTRTISIFKPLAATFSASVGQLATPTKLHNVISYDEDLFTFNGNDGVGTNSYVQKWDPASQTCLMSPNVLFQPGRISRNDFPRSVDATWLTSTSNGHTVTTTRSHNSVETAGDGWDGNTITFWCNTNANPATVTYDFGAGNGKIVTKYRVNHDGTLNNFKILGSDNDVTYTTLYSGLSASGNGLWEDHSFSNSTAFRYYKIGNTDFIKTHIFEMELWGTDNLDHMASTSVGLPTNYQRRAEQGACQTPYGLVLGGGLDAANNATKTVFVYYPHAISSFGAVIDQTIPAGLVGHWKLDETWGANANDSSVSNLDGTCMNMVDTDWVECKLNNGLDFDGTNDYVTMGDQAVYDFGLGDFTLSCWVKLDSLGNQSFVTKTDVNANTGYALRYDMGALQFLLLDSSTIRADAGALSTGVWYHVAAVRSGINLYLYKDGVLANTYTNATVGTANVDTPVALQLGTRMNGAGRDNYLDGRLDDVQIYNVALTAAQIQTAMGSSFKWKRWGASLEMPPMPGPVQGHSFIYHKGAVYRVGGSSSSVAGGALTDIYKFDLDANSWTTIAPTDPGTRLQRLNAGVCSWGDEIFIYGGMRSDGVVSSAATALNPETGKVRSLTSLPQTKDISAVLGNRWYAPCAVPCGAGIFIIGGSTSITAGGGREILKYTP